ncbi:hypothetical protein [Halomarina pelagica]|uniref:hypothetical protein n=1 Tax=Halomarina pelagica TaxID=2961599 RepID=UPI0020C2CF1C|nr:hypothetical protein [Halomarina sp. BND7]
MADVQAGEQKYAAGQTVPYELGEAAVGGEAVAISGGALVKTTGSNGFIGVLATDGASVGDRVAVHLQGVVRVAVTSGVTAGDALVPSTGTAGALTGESDGAGGTLPAGPGDLAALTDADADGYALVKLS